MKTVALIDLLSGGHRDAFMRFFVKSCLELDCKVICIYPETSVIKEWVEENLPAYKKNIRYINYSVPPPSYSKFGRLNDALKAFYYWKKSAVLFKKIEKEHSLKIDLVFYNCIDYLLGNYLPAALLDMILPYKWSGLYLHPMPFRRHPEYLDNKATFRDIDSVFLSVNCVALTLHDEGLISKYKLRLEKEVILFPEIADDTPIDENNGMAREIKEKAKGRIIVGSIGLDTHKGCYEMMKLAKAADPQKYFFAFTGGWGGMASKKYFKTEEQAEEFFQFQHTLPEHCYWKTGALKEGAEYNSVFSAFDVIWLVYKNFYSSSNRLTKASIFQRLVLASSLGCVGEDVPKYKLGEIADENNTEEQLKKLDMLRDRILQKDLPYEQWKVYAEKHSLQSLKEKFDELLNLVP